MIWFDLTFILFLVCLLLAVLLFEARRSLTAPLSQQNKDFAFRNSFSSAVAGIAVQLEEEKQNTSRFLKILDCINDGVAIMDAQGCLRYANPALWKLYGIEQSKIRNYLGESWLLLHSAQGQKDIRDKVLPILEEKKVWLGESDVQRQDRAVMRAELYISKNEEGYIGFIRDVTTRYRAEQEREKLSFQVRQLQKCDAVERVVRSIIHEFNNSLASIGGFSELLMEDLTPGTDTHDFAERIFKSGQQMQKLVEQSALLLPGTRSDPVQAADLLSVLPVVMREAEKNTAPFMLKQNILVSEANVRCDPKRLHQMLLQILQNAAEASGSENRVIDLDIALYDGKGPIPDTGGRNFYHLEDRDGRVVLQYGHHEKAKKYTMVRIADRGPGISTEVMEYILDPFFSTKNQAQKPGLGMAIVRSVVRHCEGFLMVESVENSGTRITVLLPVLEENLNDPFANGFRSTTKEDRI